MEDAIYGRWGLGRAWDGVGALHSDGAFCRLGVEVYGVIIYGEVGRPTLKQRGITIGFVKLDAHSHDHVKLSSQSGGDDIETIQVI